MGDSLLDDFLSFLVFFPAWVGAIVGLGMILLHNSFDAATHGNRRMAHLSQILQDIWKVFHVPGAVALGNVQIRRRLSSDSWMGVMAVGYAVRTVFTWPTKGDGDF